jgi:CheY-like chemotaxis protein
MQHVPASDTGMVAQRGEPVGAHPQKTILVVDDDQDVLAGMQTLLRAWGHTVIVAQSLEQASAAASSYRAELDMVVTDFRLPKRVTGVDVIHAVFQSIGHAIPAIRRPKASMPLRQAAFASCISRSTLRRYWRGSTRNLFEGDPLSRYFRMF